MRRFVAVKRKSKKDKELGEEIYRVTLNMKSKSFGNCTARQILTGDQIAQLGAIMALWARDNHKKGIKDPKGWPITLSKRRDDEDYDAYLEE